MTTQSYMKSSSKKELIASILPQNWEEQKGASFSEDDLIDAYFKGKKEEKTTNEKLFHKTFQDNLVMATGTAERFIHQVKEKGLNIITALLKVEDLFRFRVMIVVSEDDYIADSFSDFILMSSALKSEVDQDTFTINFSFTYHSDDLSDDCLAADGYKSKYAGKG